MTPAHAGSTVHATEQLLFSTLLQLIVMIGAARAMNTLFRRLGQPGAVGEILAGLMLGPSLFGRLFPGASAYLFGAGAAQPITILSQIGLLLLMFGIGADFEFGHLKSRRNSVAVGVVAAVSVAAPLALGIAAGFGSAAALAPGIDRLAYSLFVGVAVAITAVPILGRILAEYRLNRTEVGVVAISAAALNDVTGWVALAGVSSYAAARFSGGGLALTLGGIAALVLALGFVARPLVDRLVRAFPLEDGRLAPNLMAAVLALIFALGICTFELGIFAIFGGFAAGLLFHRHTAFVEAWRRQVGQFVLVFFLPVFFTYTGLRTDVLGLDTWRDAAWLGVFLLVSIAGKIAPVYLAGRACGFDARQSWLLGALMNTRALMELIVLNVGFDLGVVPRKVFTMLVVMAVVTTLMTGPLLKLILARRGEPRLQLAEA